MSILENIFNYLTHIIEKHSESAGQFVDIKVASAKFIFHGTPHIFGLCSVVLLTMSNREINDALRTIYILLAILFICLSLLWAGWKNKQLTIEIISYFKNPKHKKNDAVKRDASVDDEHDILQ